MHTVKGSGSKYRITNIFKGFWAGIDFHCEWTQWTDKRRENKGESES